MSDLYRSCSMTYVRILIPSDNIYQTIRSLGEFGLVHIIDLTAGEGQPTEHTVYYKKRVQQCIYWQRKLLQLRDTAIEHNVSMPSVHDDGVVIDDVQVRSGAIDLLDSLSDWIMPLEQQLTKNILFKREHDLQQQQVYERLLVLQYVQQHHLLTSHLQRQQDGTYEVVDEESQGSLIKHSIGLGKANGRTKQSTKYSRLIDAQDDGDVEEENDSASLLEGGRGYGNGAQQSSTSYNGSYQPSSLSDYISSNICGVIPSDKAMLFERMLFRATRGNCFIRLLPITEQLKDPITQQVVQKQVFVITYIGQQLRRRISKLILHFGAVEYSIPTTAGTQELNNLQQELDAQVHEMQMIGHQTEQEIHRLLSSLAYDTPSLQSSPLLNWLAAIAKEAAISDVIRQCSTNASTTSSHTLARSSNTLRLEGWLPRDELESLRTTLHHAARNTTAQNHQTYNQNHQPVKQSALQIVSTSQSPPTYFRTNAFTASFQGIVDTYGVPKYKEVNPGLFTVISFPFLFGVMYGDLLHGTCITLFSLYLIMNQRAMLRQEKRGEMNEIMQMIFSGRFLMLMMGMFAVYCGSIYNDMASVPTSVFTSQWQFTRGQSAAVRKEDQGIYPWGLDYSWYHTSNQLAFFNSFKMKIAVIIGVTHMTFGVLLSYQNHKYFHNRLAMVYEFIPRLLFLLCTFGYMILLIIIKWCINWEEATTAPPNLVQTMIGMFLSPGNVEPQNQLYAGQAIIQVLLLLVALGSVPVMLFAIPLISKRQHEEKFKPFSPRSSHFEASSPLLNGGRPYSDSISTNRSTSSTNSGNSDGGDEYNTVNGHRNRHNGNGVHLPSDVDVHLVPVSAVDHVTHGDTEEGGSHAHGADPMSIDYNFTDHLITSGIHTIEYVLGTVSNTASYLRLWALSLAHAELADVFWSKIMMQYGLEQANPAFAVIGMAVWAGATFSVLLCMDVLECFLHALRLHWVEFQNKFYEASGYAFHPFDFHKVAELS